MFRLITSALMRQTCYSITCGPNSDEWLLYWNITSCSVIGTSRISLSRTRGLKSPNSYEIAYDKYTESLSCPHPPMHDNIVYRRSVIWRYEKWLYRPTLVHPKTQHLFFKASLALTVYISPVMADRCFSLRAVFMLIGQRASQMGGTFPPRWREQRENLKQLFWRDCSWFIGFIKQLVGGFLTL